MSAWIIVGAFLLLPSISQAVVKTTNQAVTHLGWAKIKSGYTVSSASGDIRMEVGPKIFPRPATVTVKRASPKKAKLLKYPSDLKKVSPVYEYDVNIDPIAFFNNQLPLVVKYNSKSTGKREVRFWNTATRSWLPLRSVDLGESKEIRAFVHFPFSKIAVFEERTTHIGRASWYNASDHPMSASTDLYPIGTKVRVTNTDTGKSIIVVIHSTWAGVDGRVIDLTRDAFAALGEIGAGTLPVKIEPSVESRSNPAPTNGNAPPITAVSAIVVDPTIDRMIYEKNLQQRPIASITKLMTALVVLETKPDFKRELEYVADDNTSADGSSIDLSPGDKLAFDEALKAALIASANNAAKLLSRTSVSSKEEFVRRMNQKAKDLKMNFTKFVEPTGLDDGNVSTPGDIAKLVEAAMKRDEIRSLTVMASDAISANTYGPKSQRVIRYVNTNKVLGRIPGIVGGKTGYLGNGHANFALKVSAGSKTRIVVILGSRNGTTRNEDMVRLANWALAQS